MEDEDPGDGRFNDENFLTPNGPRTFNTQTNQRMVQENENNNANRQHIYPVKRVKSNNLGRRRSESLRRLNQRPNYQPLSMAPTLVPMSRGSDVGLTGAAMPVQLAPRKSRTFILVPQEQLIPVYQNQLNVTPRKSTSLTRLGQRKSGTALTPRKSDSLTKVGPRKSKSRTNLGPSDPTNDLLVVRRGSSSERIVARRSSSGTRIGGTKKPSWLNKNFYIVLGFAITFAIIIWGILEIINDEVDRKAKFNSTLKPILGPSSMSSFTLNSKPTSKPDSNPTSKPDSNPTSKPDSKPTSKPDSNPTSKPDSKPTSKPNSNPTSKPTSKPDSKPTSKPNSNPTSKPTSKPDSKPTSKPDSKPDSNPTSKPDSKPTSKPDSNPSSNPTSNPTSKPTSKPDSKPDSNPTSNPTSKPTSKPDSKSTFKPTSKPTSRPDSKPNIGSTFGPIG